jgi:hypothetical protein
MLAGTLKNVTLEIAVHVSNIFSFGQVRQQATTVLPYVYRCVIAEKLLSSCCKSSTVDGSDGPQTWMLVAALRSQDSTVRLLLI